MFRNTVIILALAMVVLVATAQQPPPAPAPTPAPTPPAPNTNHSSCNFTTTKPTPEVKKYAFKECTLAQFGAYLAVGQDKFINLQDGKVDEALSNCNGTSQGKLVINFTCADLDISFQHANTSNFVYGLTGHYWINGTETTFTNTSSLFKTSGPGRYYKCNSEQAITMVQPNVSLHLNDFGLEVFRNNPSPDFYQVVDQCLLDAKPDSDMVRIGVGVCLIALVAIVIVAYFIGRRRWSERSSYESV